MASSRIGLVLLALASGAGCRTASADDSPAPRVEAAVVPVRLAPVARGSVARPIRGTGTVRLKSEVDLSFKIGGIVEAVLVDEGTRVRRGQVLARLDPTEVSAALRQADEAVVKAERDFDRVARLHASGALPPAQRDDADTAVRLAKAARDAAAFAARRAVIVAPDDGRVDRRLLEPGEVVSPGRPVLRVSGRSRGAVVRVALTDRDVLRLRIGDPATVRLDARPEEELRATVTQIATAANPATGTFDAEVRLEAGEGLLSGLTAKVVITHDEPDLVSVPAAALVDGHGDRAAVFVVEGDRARKVPVRVAFLDGARAALCTPLAGHRDVVTSGAMRLEDGAAVVVVP